MKKILSLLGTITLIGTSATSLVACNTTQYSEDELQQLKKENQICTNCKEIKDNLEWIYQQEKPFNQVDNKWYYVVWRGDKNGDWRIVKFLNNSNLLKIDNFNNRQLEKTDLAYGKDLYISNNSGFIKYVSNWQRDDGAYFKAFYRWNLDTNEPYLIINDNDNIKVNEEI
ncbi:lipoprotein [Spiroplasma phoeniceum]|uniref:Lipoprotein n=1 Tax=Spiroplasma phoeniceum P40 TaxID=1276259 RepID=A0A345DN48_9MOLU|nr:lipoprotein [Spiroplasma phoeniceum]AXF95636.1 putative lipoprotein [Spiroplasma phoeniceum P40]